MKKLNFRKYLSIFLILLMFFSLSSCGEIENLISENEDIFEIDRIVKEGEAYYSLEDVSNYIYKYQKLPHNYIKKNEARKLGWKPEFGNLWDLSKGLVIGGDRFGNREGLLPKKDGRVYFEADFDYQGGKRNAKRIVYSNDGLIFYTIDHYKTFKQVNFND